MTKSLSSLTMAWLIGIGLVLTTPAIAFDSGSSGVDGIFNPTTNTTLQLPPDGIFNFTSVNIPAGVTVQFAKNTINTPATFLVSGDVLVDGDITLFGRNSTHSGAAGGGNQSDDGNPGRGVPGGFDGGRGGEANKRGGHGLGPGAGISGSAICTPGNDTGNGGSGAGYGTTGGNSGSGATCRELGGPGHGSLTLLPLIGGSGGGGGHGGPVFDGTGGSGGGGAILIAASGRVTVNGVIRSNGGHVGQSSGAGCGGTGGTGSGGAIRIVATTIAGNGAIVAVSQNRATNQCNNTFGRGGAGSVGRIRLEAETMLRTAATTPAFFFAQPQAIFVAGLPSLSITSVAGMSAPGQPTGNADIVLPESTPNPVAVIFTTTNVPLGQTILLTLTPVTGVPINVTSNAISGTEANGTASANINLTSGPSTLSARVSFTVIASLGNDLSRFAQGEQVEHITLAANMNGPSMTTLITVSGKEYTLPSNQVAAF